MYMIYQQYITAVRDAYSGKSDVSQNFENARSCREWLESLNIKADLRDSLVEPMRVLEEVFQDLVDQSE